MGKENEEGEKGKTQTDVVVHACSPYTWEAKTEGPVMNLRPAWTTQQYQVRLHLNKKR